MSLAFFRYRYYLFVIVMLRVWWVLLLGCFIPFALMKTCAGWNGVVFEIYYRWVQDLLLLTCRLALQHANSLIKPCLYNIYGSSGWKSKNTHTSTARVNEENLLSWQMCKQQLPYLLDCKPRLMMFSLFIISCRLQSRGLTFFLCIIERSRWRPFFPWLHFWTNLSFRILFSSASRAHPSQEGLRWTEGSCCVNITYRVATNTKRAGTRKWLRGCNLRSSAAYNQGRLTIE